MSLPGGIFPALSREQGSGVAQLSHSHYSTRQFVLCLVTQIETAFTVLQTCKFAFISSYRCFTTAE
jgi:hypothetical protein